MRVIWVSLEGQKTESLPDPRSLKIPARIALATNFLPSSMLMFLRSRLPALALSGFELTDHLSSRSSQLMLQLGNSLYSASMIAMAAKEPLPMVVKGSLSVEPCG